MRMWWEGGDTSSLQWPGDSPSGHEGCSIEDDLAVSLRQRGPAPDRPRVMRPEHPVRGTAVAARRQGSDQQAVYLTPSPTSP